MSKFSFDYYCINVLTAMAPNLNGELLKKGIVAAFTLSQKYPDRAYPLAAFFPRLEGQQKIEGLHRIMKAIRTTSLDAERTEVFNSLVPKLDYEMLRLALDKSISISDEEKQISALAKMACRLEGEIKVETVLQGLITIPELSTDEARASALITLAPLLEGDLLQWGLEAALAIVTSHFLVIKVLEVMAPHMTDDLLSAALDKVFQIPEEWVRAKALEALAPRLKGILLHQGLDSALRISRLPSRAAALIAFLPCLNDKEREYVFHESLKTALAVDYEDDYGFPLSKLALELKKRKDGMSLRRLLDATQRLAKNELGIRVGLNSFTEQKREFYKYTHEDIFLWLASIDQGRAQALEEMAPYLEGDLLQKGLDAALAISEDDYRAKALAALAPRLDDKIKAEIADRELKHAQTIRDDQVRGYVIGNLAPILSKEQVHQILQAATAIGDERSRAFALEKLAAGLEGELVGEGLQAALTISDEELCASALASLVPRLADVYLEQGIQAALAIINEKYRAKVLEAIIPKLKGNQINPGYKFCSLIPRCPTAVNRVGGISICQRW